MEACRRFVAGVFYAVLHQWGTLWVPDSYFNSQEFFVSNQKPLFIFCLGPTILLENVLEHHLVQGHHDEILYVLAVD